MPFEASGGKDQEVIPRVSGWQRQGTPDQPAVGARLESGQEIADLLGAWGRPTL